LRIGAHGASLRTVKPFVPGAFEPPLSLDHEAFRLRPLGPEHNESDHAAWSGSIEHIRATPGFPDGAWPRPMSLEDNHADLVRHASDFAARTGFTYTVLQPDADRVIGCVYIYPTDRDGFDASCTSWVRKADASLDATLHEVVRAWLARDFPFRHVDYAGRPVRD
jgi:hypothetical protein